MNNWYVLTGGPGAGKTTLLEELKHRGHTTIKESARNFIEQELARGLSIETIRKDEKSFQEAVFRQKQIIHEALDMDAVTFFDRGYHDTIAYLEQYHYKIADYIAKICQQPIYKKVFVLDMLPYEKDEARIEDSHTAKALHARIIEAYSQSGHQIFHIPTMPVSDRADYVLDNL